MITSSRIPNADFRRSLLTEIWLSGFAFLRFVHAFRERSMEARHAKATDPALPS
jgi:hypothetical protein